jgi:hypothetical protein
MTGEKHVDVDGIRTRYFKKGSGPLVWCPVNSLNNICIHSTWKNLPLPLFSKEGQGTPEKISPFAKGDEGGFERELRFCHTSEF